MPGQELQFLVVAKNKSQDQPPPSGIAEQSVRCQPGRMPHDTTQKCKFSTERLVVGEWHLLADEYGLDLIAIIRSVLTKATTAALPPDWNGDYDDERAKKWVDARDAESPTLLVVETESGLAVGFLILFESVSRDEHARIDVRLGYVLAESAWGRGLATELVHGLVLWARSELFVHTISGGVAESNDPSAHVLLKNGFKPLSAGGGERTYALTLA